MPQKEIVIDPSKIDPSENGPEAKALRDLIDYWDKSPDQTLKLTKSRGTKASGLARNKSGYNLDDKTVHLENFSLIRFPNSDRYYVIGKELGKGAMGKVKVLPIYFKKDSHGGLTRHEEPDQQEIIKIIKSAKGGRNVQEAHKEALLAREAGGHKDAVSGFNPDSPYYTGYAKMPKASGMDLENYLANHPDITLQERLKMIKMVMKELEEIRKRGYYYVDIKPENIFYDGKKITFVDWGSAGKEADMAKTPGSPMFTSAYQSNASQREAYAVAGLIGIILSDFRDNKLYDRTPVIKPKYEAEDMKATLFADYNFSKISDSFNLKKNSDEAKALNAIVDNLKMMGHQQPTIRDKISNNSYKILIDNIDKLELSYEKSWLKSISQELEKSLDKSLRNSHDDSKRMAIEEFLKFSKAELQKDHIEDVKSLVKLLDDVIEKSAAKQEGKLFGSNVLKMLKSNLPPEVSNLLSNQDKLNEYHSASVFRFFGSKKTPVEMEPKKEPTRRPSQSNSKQ